MTPAVFGFIVQTDVRAGPAVDLTGLNRRWKAAGMTAEALDLPSPPKMFKIHYVNKLKGVDHAVGFAYLVTSFF